MTSTASIGKHPIHPVLVAFPIGLWVFSLLSDIIFLSGGNSAWSTVSRYSMRVGILGALLAALPGFVDLLTTPSAKIKRIGAWHMSINLVVTAIFVVDFFLRANKPGVPAGPFVLSIIGVALLAVSGWLGGEMVYVHGAGVQPPMAKPGPEAPAREREEVMAGRG